MNLTKLTEKFHKETKAYYDKLGRKQRIHEIIEKLEADWGSGKLERQDAAFDAWRKNGQD